MQNQNAIIKSGQLLKPYNGIFNCFATSEMKASLNFGEATLDFRMDLFPLSGARAEILVCGAYNDTVLLIIYLAGVIRAAKGESDNDSGSSSSFAIRWKDP
ncbi:hypothetical protein Golax_020874 [Gossypium laxum]|uniref:Uncharacterized protein n=1 Tax=Gossypium laxum TaxID=34288 RepID=A0A7J9AJC2_9ROSI|nr:hypothetical protein [Gossypium laxum]